MLVSVNSRWRFKRDGAGGKLPPRKDRMQRLARSLDALARKDETMLRQTHEIGALRRQAAVELHGICGAFVRDLNSLLAVVKLELQPEEYTAANFNENGVNLFQINARGRIVQIKFEATPELVSTEDFRVPYILAGAVRCFNQQLLEKDLIEEQLLFYTVERTRSVWRFFDARTYRSGSLDAEYLVGLMEQLV